MKRVRKNSLQAWFLAARPKTLTAAATPVLTACALAYREDCFRWRPAIICLVFALLAQIVSNFFNDYFDYKKGADCSDRLGPKRAVAEGWIAPRTMLLVAFGLLAADMGIGLLLVRYGGWILIPAGVLIALFAIAYSGGPYPLAYHGWGDACGFMFFGVVPVGFAYYVQALQWTPSVVVCGAATGLVIVNILVANNYRDRDLDARANKKTTVVLFGERFGRYFYLSNGALAVICCQYFLFTHAIWAGIFPLVYLFLHLKTWNEMICIGSGKQLVGILEKTACNVFIFGCLLSLGLIVSRVVN